MTGVDVLAEAFHEGVFRTVSVQNIDRVGPFRIWVRVEWMPTGVTIVRAVTAIEAVRAILLGDMNGVYMEADF